MKRRACSRLGELPALVPLPGFRIDAEELGNGWHRLIVRHDTGRMVLAQTQDFECYTNFVADALAIIREVRAPAQRKPAAKANTIRRRKTV